MRTKILLTILFFSQLLTLGSALVDYSVNPINPASGADSTQKNPPATTGQCINGYTWNSQLCVPCMQVKYGYCTCTDYGGCETKVCDLQKYSNCQVLTNGSQSYLLLKEPGCTQYGWGDQNQSIICTSCSAGYFLVAGICVKANYCAQMNLVTGTCDTCVDGFYFTQNYQLKTLQSWDYYQNINEVICNPCLTNCKICTSGYTCVQCQDEYYWSPTTQKTTLSNQLNNQLAGQCLACSSNISNCIKCSNSLVCDKCKDGYYYVAGSDSTQKGTCTPCMNNCLSCKDGTTCDICNTVGGYLYLQTTNNNSCALCTGNGNGQGIAYCGTCSTSTGQLVCQSCLAGYVFDSNNVCKQCDPNCASGSCSYTNDQVQCSRCKDSTFILKSNTTCNSCGTGCTSCTQDQGQANPVCQQCSDTYYLDNNNTCQLCNSTITNCSTCSFNNNNTPKVTCTNCSANTKKTNDNQQCVSAPSNCLEYSVTDNGVPPTCSKCADTYYLDSSTTPATCKACTTSNANYLRCSVNNNNQVVPIQCQNQYFLLDGTCVSVTTSNTQATNLTLQTCLTIQAPGGNNQCLKCLPAALGTSPPQGGVCSYCNCTNKDTCSATVDAQKSTVSCTSNSITCVPGFLLNGSSCLPCSPVVANPIDNTKYQACCGLGLIYSSGPDQCVSQSATGTARCITSNANNACICDTGYYSSGDAPANYQCNKCLANCDKCTDNTTCTTCADNYTKIVTSNNATQCVQIKCLGINSTTGCTLCQYGFYMQKINGVNYCLQCLSPLTNSVCRQYSNIAPIVTITPATPVVAQANPSYVCANGNYWNGQYCSPCKSLVDPATPTVSPNGYCTCSTYLDCTAIVCNTGYALVKSKCVLIPEGCNTYQISNDGTTLICTACQDTFSLVSNVCMKTQFCSSFSSTTGNCAQCANGYYLNWQYNTFVSQGVLATSTNPYFFNFPSQCTACDISNCSVCTGPKVCTTCATGYYWQISQYLQQSSNNSQGSCQPCMQGCQVCTNNQSCQSCFAGYYMVFPYSGINYCQLCSTPISNCLTCDNPTAPPHPQSLVPTCRSCSTGFFLYNSKCVICPTGCLSCDGDNSCTQCVSQGYAYDQTNKKCTLCSQIVGCTSCAYNGTTLTCSVCADLYYRTTNQTTNITTCSLCSAAGNQQAPSNYLRCTSATSPTQCKDGFYLNGSSCTTINSTLHCLTFDNGGNCTSCVSGYIIVGNQCQFCTTATNAQCAKCQVISGTGTAATLQCAACTNGYYLTTTNGCAPCVKSDGCSTCNASGCATCISGYYPTNVTTDTNNNTGNGTSNNSVNCNKCVTNCSVCQQANSCTKCADGYFLVTTTTSGTTSVTTSSCFACQPECQTCVAPGTTCTSCISGYVFQNGGCVTLAQANCYSNGSNGCEVCYYGYYLNNGVCYQCINPQADFICTNPVDNLLTSVQPPSPQT